MDALQKQRLLDADIAVEDALARFMNHTLKGVTGNLSMQALYRQTCAMVEDLRAGALEDARQKLPALQAQYRLTLTALEGL